MMTPPWSQSLLLHGASLSHSIPNPPSHQSPTGRSRSTLKSCLRKTAALGAVHGLNFGGAPSRDSGDKTATQGEVREEDEWSRVLPRHRWCRPEFKSQGDSRSPPTCAPATRPALTELLRGKCLRCLTGDHLVADCRDPVRCLRCKRYGHKARACRASNPPRRAHGQAPPPPLQRPPSLDQASYPELPRRAMAQSGDPALRPEETSAVAASNSAMDEELERLSTCAVVASLFSDKDDVAPEHIKKAVCSRLGVRPADVKVTRHRPEDFLLDFTFPRHREATLALKRLSMSNLDVRIKPWRVLPYGDNCELRHHVRLCLEGIPAHAWNESIAKRAVAWACDLDYVDTRSLRRDDTGALCLWAWTHNPSDIPKVTWLTLTGSLARFHDGVAPPRGHRGLTFRVIVHLDLIESPPNDYGRTTTRKLTWRYGIIDGERGLRVQHDPSQTDARAERSRDGDADADERRGCREDKARGWGSRLSRSLSRAPARERERGCSESRHGRRYDRSSTTDGHRRCGSADKGRRASPAAIERRRLSPPPQSPRSTQGHSDDSGHSGRVQNTHIPDDVTAADTQDGGNL